MSAVSIKVPTPVEDIASEIPKLQEPEFPFKLPDLFANHIRRKKLLELETKHPSRPHTRILIADYSKPKAIKKHLSPNVEDVITIVEISPKKEKPTTKRKKLHALSQTHGNVKIMSDHAEKYTSKSSARSKGVSSLSRTFDTSGSSHTIDDMAARSKSSGGNKPGPGGNEYLSVMEQGRRRSIGKSLASGRQISTATQRKESTTHHKVSSTSSNTHFGSISAVVGGNLPVLPLSNAELSHNQTVVPRVPSVPITQPVVSTAARKQPPPLSASIFAYSTIPKATPLKRVRIGNTPNPNTPYRKMQHTEVEQLQAFLMEKGLSVCKDVLSRAFFIPQEIIKPPINIGHVLKGYGIKYVKPTFSSSRAQTADEDESDDEYDERFRIGKVSSRGKGLLPVHKVAVFAKEIRDVDAEDVVNAEPKTNSWWTAQEYRDLRIGWNSRKVKKIAALLEVERSKRLATEPFNSFVKEKPLSPNKNTKNTRQKQTTVLAKQNAMDEDSISVCWFPTRSASRTESRPPSQPSPDVLHLQQSYSRYKPGVLC
ncbi:hypothetical protein BC830DRAFT_1110940 [Chytriomyces sp. MP71]|nr:hypothetical protein BC830DRAFT_1110940 [Chytriomyces sp. MP71]